MLHPFSEAAGWAGPPSTSSRSPPDVPESTPQLAIGAWTQPVATSQRSAVHAFPSSQLPHAVQTTAPGPAVVPAGHAEHVAAPAAADVPAAHGVQLATPAAEALVPAGHAVHSVFAVVVQAVAWKVPISQTLHALQPPPLRKKAVGQLPHWFGFGPEQAVQLASQAPQTVFAVAVHAAD